MTEHRCHAPNCSAMVPHNVFMCARHWRALPKPLRQAISEGWSMGGGSPYRANCDEAIRIIGEFEGGIAPDLPTGTKALTIWQPWASLVMIGAKPWEFRRWSFTDRPGLRKLVGQRIVIHAGARPPKPSEVRDILARIEGGESALEADRARPWLEGLHWALLEKKVGGAPLAAALGTAVIGEPVKASKLFDKVADSDRIDQHMYAWPLTDIDAWKKPVKAAGAQGFWNW
ncbi:hypothetical protein [Afipia carboxidovorans]|uniref:hypothetical protein n=1 Tax=Afipia carboxidovorans TaxID=40137 RepID=UPI003092C240|nr:hypothetical protein CRBSH125_09210 [Afipia carboxidovorans]